MGEAAAAVFVGFDSAIKIPAGAKRIHHHHQVIASEEPGQVITKTGGLATMSAGTWFQAHGKNTDWMRIMNVSLPHTHHR